MLRPLRLQPYHVRVLVSPSAMRSLSTIKKVPLQEEVHEPSFALSGAGFLSPFHIGAVQALKETHLLHGSSKVAGASGGALVAAATVCGLSPSQQMDSYRKLVSHCRTEGFVGKIRNALIKNLHDQLPANAHDMCKDRLSVAVMSVWPKFSLSPIMVDHFTSKQDLIQALVTSSHIPFYLDKSAPWTSFRGGLYVDGGLVELIPPMKGAVRVSVFPAYLIRPFSTHDIHIEPHKVPGFPFSIHQLVQWALFAPDDASADRLLIYGYDAALAWATQQKQQGVKGHTNPNLQTS